MCLTQGDETMLGHIFVEALHSRCAYTMDTSLPQATLHDPAPGGGSHSASTMTPPSAERGGRALEMTKLCKFFRSGHCQRGSACTFAHGKKQLRPQPDLFRTQLCEDFAATGACRFGAACRYAHGAGEVRPADLVKPPRPGRRRGARGARGAMGGAAAALVEASGENSDEAQRWTQELHDKLDLLLTTQTAFDGSEDAAHTTGTTSPIAWADEHNSDVDDASKEGHATTEEESVEFEEEESVALPTVVRVRNTFLEVVLAADPHQARRRARSAPCGL